LKKKIVLSAAVLTLLFSAVMRIPFIPSVRARTWTVDDDGPADFHTIQEAIDAANESDIIFVSSGVYYEHVVVNKAIQLIGENEFDTIIDAGSTGTVMKVAANNVNISGFTVQNSGPGYNMGIYVTSNGNNISGNIVKSNEYGIIVSGSSNNILTGNKISNNGLGIHLGYSNNNTIANNNISHCKWEGVDLIYSNNNALIGNNASNNSYGIRIYKSSNNTLTDNVASSNWYGIDLHILSAGNTLTGNAASKNQYNFGVRDLDFPGLNNYVDVTNTVDGKPIYYLTGAANAIIDTQTNAGTVYLINCNNITIKDLTLTKNLVGVSLWNTTNSRIENVIAKNNDRCEIALMYSYNNILTGNNASSNNVYGIYLGDSNNNTLIGNTVSNNGFGDVAFQRGGLWLSRSSNNTLSGNTITNNDWHGLGLYRSPNNSVCGNNITNNEYGIRLWVSSNNRVSGNIITNNGHGIILDQSSNNTIYHNNFVHNLHQVYDESWEYPQISPSVNIWDSGYPSGGNYWSDYNGTDLHSGPYQNETGSDYIGDAPYRISGIEEDRYPFVSPYDPATYGAVQKYIELRMDYNSLYSILHELVVNHSLLIDNFHDLNMTYHELLDDYNILQASYNELQSNQRAIIKELDSIRNLMYAFVAISVVLTITTVYLGMKTTQRKKHEREQPNFLFILNRICIH